MKKNHNTREAIKKRVGSAEPSRKFLGSALEKANSLQERENMNQKIGAVPGKRRNFTAKWGQCQPC